MNVKQVNKTFFAQLDVDCDQASDTPDLYKHETERKLKVKPGLQFEVDMIKCVELCNVNDMLAATIGHEINSSHHHADTSNISIVSPLDEHHFHPHPCSAVINSLSKSSSSDSDACSSTRPLLGSCQTLAKVMESQSCIAASHLGSGSGKIITSDDILLAGETNKMMPCKHVDRLMCNCDCDCDIKSDINNEAIDRINMIIENPVETNSSLQDTFSNRFWRFLSEQNRWKFKEQSKKVNTERQCSLFKCTKHSRNLLISKFLMFVLIVVLISAIIITVVGSLNKFSYRDNHLVASNKLASMIDGNLFPDYPPKHGHYGTPTHVEGNEAMSDEDWWQEVAIYEVFPASFKDSDNNGYGDLRGIVSKLRYLKELGIQVIRLNSVFQSLDYPHDYDRVVNYTRVDQHIGSLSDLVNLVNHVHSSGIRIIMDMNLCYTSSQHLWALKWAESNANGRHWEMSKSHDDYKYYSDNSYKHFYVSPSSFMQTTSPRSSAGAKSEDVKSPESTSASPMKASIKKALLEPLYLNWSSSVVQTEFSKILLFWCKQGIDGFYLQNIHQLHIDGHSFITLLDVVRDLRSFIDEHCSSRTIIAADRASLDIVNQRLIGIRKSKQHKRSTARVLNLIASGPPKEDIFFYFQLIIDVLPVIKNDAEKVRDRVNDFFLNGPASSSRGVGESGLPNTTRPSIAWCLGDSRTSRFATRIGKKYMSAALFLLIMLPGSVNLLYGDEIALQDSIDPSSGKPVADGQLPPLSWTSELFGGFTDDIANGTQPWIPMNMDYISNNIQENRDSIPKIRQLLSYRKLNWSSTSGERYFIQRSSSPLIGNDKRRRFVLFANFGDVQRVKDFSDKFFFGSIKLATNTHRMHEFLYLKYLVLEPGEAIIAEIE